MRFTLRLPIKLPDISVQIGDIASVLFITLCWYGRINIIYECALKIFSLALCECSPHEEKSETLWNNKIIYLPIRHDKNHSWTDDGEKSVRKNKRPSNNAACWAFERLRNLEMCSHGESKKSFKPSSESFPECSRRETIAFPPLHTWLSREPSRKAHKMLSCPINWNIKKIYCSFLMLFIIW